MEKLLTANHAKAYQRTDQEYRIKPYLAWHRTLDRALYMLDADSIEWRFKNNELVAVGVMEITRVDEDEPVKDAYLQQILNRFERDLQGKVSKKLAASLNTYAYIVLFRYNCTEFFVYNLSLGGTWLRCNAEQYHEFLKKL